MKKTLLLFLAFMLAAPHAAIAGKKQAAISGAKTDTHVSGAYTPQDNHDDKIHASGATTHAADKAASAKNAGQNGPRHPAKGTQKSNGKHPAPGEVRKPYQPKEATVEQPQAPKPPRTPNIPRDK